MKAQAKNVVADEASQVPTMIVYTSAESASSVETQFTAICDKLKLQDCLEVVLDEKKCANTKKMIMAVFTFHGPLVLLSHH